MSQFYMPRAQIADVAGRPYIGALFYFYAAGTSTPLATYSDAALTVPLPQPVVTNAAGILPAVYTPAGLYKVIVTDSSGVLIWSQDNIDPAVSTSLGAIAVANGGTGATTAANARANLGAASSAALTATQTDLATNYYSKVINPIATQAEAIAGTDATRLMSALSVKQVLAARGPAPDFWFRDEKASGTDGGTFTNGADQTRTLNTQKINVPGLGFNGSGGAAANQFILPAGNWWVQWVTPAYVVNQNQSLLYNISDAVEIGRSRTTSQSSGAGTYHLTQGNAYFTLAATKTLELRHRCATTRATDGFGAAVGFGTEIYAEIWGWQVQ